MCKHVGSALPHTNAELVEFGVAARAARRVKRSNLLGSKLLKGGYVMDYIGEY